MRSSPESGLSDDSWIISNSPLPADKLHAIGVIAFRWNQCEFALLILLADIAELPRRDVWAMVHDLGDISICERVRTFTDFRIYPTSVKDLIKNGLDFYDKCRQNRNVVIHAWTVSAYENTTLARRSKRPHDPEPTPFRSELSDLRRVAEEIEVLSTRLWLLDVLVDEYQQDAALLASLKILPVPELLSTPFQRGSIKPRRPPRSSPR
jgi:hypothetical protein